MGMKVLRISTAEHLEATLALPAGRIFASGKGSCPTSRSAVRALSAFCDVFEPPAPVEPEPAVPPQVIGVPQQWTDVGVGSLVLATTGEENAGWFEAIVAECRVENVLVLRWTAGPSSPSSCVRSMASPCCPPRRRNLDRTPGA